MSGFYLSGGIRAEFVLPLAAQSSPLFRVITTRLSPRFLRNALLDVCTLSVVTVNYLM